MSIGYGLLYSLVPFKSFSLYVLSFVQVDLTPKPLGKVEVAGPLRTEEKRPSTPSSCILIDYTLGLCVEEGGLEM